MKIFLRLLLFVVFVSVLSASDSVARSMEQERAMCIALNALARTQCKDPAEFSYIGMKGDSVYIFNSFYGSKYTDFFCKVGEGEVVILSRKKRFRRSVKYYIDDNECGVIEFFPASCSKKNAVRCCFPKSEKEKKADKELEFWQKPIPDLLQEDQKEALEELQNRTAKSSESKPQSPPTE